MPSLIVAAPESRLAIVRAHLGLARSATPWCRRPTRWLCWTTEATAAMAMLRQPLDLQVRPLQCSGARRNEARHLPSPWRALRFLEHRAQMNLLLLLLLLHLPQGLHQHLSRQPPRSSPPRPSPSAAGPSPRPSNPPQGTAGPLGARRRLPLAGPSRTTRARRATRTAPARWTAPWPRRTPRCSQRRRWRRAGARRRSAS